MLADSEYSTTRCGAKRMTQRETRAGIVSGWKLRIISVVMKVVEAEIEAEARDVECRPNEKIAGEVLASG